MRQLKTGKTKTNTSNTSIFLKRSSFMRNMILDLTFMPANTLVVFNKLAEHRFITTYTLVGGTALSIQLGHRLSEDLDFIFIPAIWKKHLWKTIFSQ
jgi:hypothetical protein